MLAALAVTVGAEDAIARQIREKIGKRSEVVSLFGGWPWTHHALKVRIDPASGVVRIYVEGCRVLRTNETTIVTLTDVLLRVLEQDEERATDCWLSPKANVHVNADVGASRGWRLIPKTGRKRPLDPFRVRPEWARTYG